MKIKFRVDEHTWIEDEAGSDVEAFQSLSHLNEIFGNRECKKCHSKNPTFAVRKASSGKKEFMYHELRCNNPDCRAKLSFGISEENGMFPIRFKREDGENVKDENGKNIPAGNWGWVKFNRETGEEE